MLPPKRKVAVKPKAKKKENELVSCNGCKFSYLMQNGEINPIIAECRRNTEEPIKERFVSSSLHKCWAFEEETEEKNVNPMIFVTKIFE